MGIIKIVQDIIDTYGSWDIKNTKSYERKAVFFIDEIEAHLHPRWESRVIPLLKKFFPQAIFYITTHSPTVVGSTQEGEAYELVNFDGIIKAKKLGDPRSWYLADVYSQAFHLEDFLEKREEDKKEVRDEFKIFSNLVKSYLKTKNQEKLKEGLELAQRLEANLSTDDPRLMTLNNLKSLLQ
jgi:predicted ATP-binding protein involved in virulence